MQLKQRLEENDVQTDCRTKLLKFLEENREMEGYLQHVQNADITAGAAIGILLSIIGAELIYFGMMLA
jgi:hypothetical protein